MNFKNVLLTLSLLVLSLPLFSKIIYLKYDPACMDRYEYRLNNNMKGGGIIAYSVYGAGAEKLMLEIGVESIKRVKRLPRGTKSCNKFDVDLSVSRAINSGKDKIYIVRQAGDHYIISLVHLSTFFKETDKEFQLEGHKFNMLYAKQKGASMESNLADRDSPTKIFFVSVENQACTHIYRVKKIPQEASKPYSDLAFVSGIGLTEEKTGLTPEEADNNALRLVKINNIPLKTYIEKKCEDNSLHKRPITQPQKDEELAEKQALKPSTTSKPKEMKDEGEAEKPVSYELVYPISDDKIATEHLPAGSEIIYPYSKAKNTIATFRPKGQPCTQESYPGVHIVAIDQTLYSISRRYGVTVDQLRSWNQLNAEDRIDPCQRLYVLPPEAVEANSGGVFPFAFRKPSNTVNHTTSTSSAEIVFKNTSSGKGESSPDEVGSNRNIIPYNNVDAINDIYAKAANKTEILYPKSGVATASGKHENSDVDCNKIAYPGIHIVKKNETLYSIAKNYGLSVEQLMTWNKLDQKEPIKPCMSIYLQTPNRAIAEDKVVEKGRGYTIPASEINIGYTNVSPSGIERTITNISKGAKNRATVDKMWNSGIEYHIVQKGETLAGLAKTYGFTIERFKDINQLGEKNIIYIGQVLRTGNCLCPAGSPPPGSTQATLPVNPAGSAATTYPGNTVLVPDNSEVFSEKGRENVRKNEGMTEFMPVPTPYNYEAESAIIHAKSNPAVSLRNGRKVHTVRENETLAFIANQYNIPLEILRKLNNMEKGEIVIPHQTIYIE